jgi:hypothetical protein
VHFVGYLHFGDLNPNLKLNEKNVKTENEESEHPLENGASLDWPNQNSLISNSKNNNNNNNITKTNGSSDNGSRSIASSNSLIPNLQHYLITCGKIKQPDDELIQNKFITRHDADGKFIYLESMLVFFL